MSIGTTVLKSVVGALLVTHVVIPVVVHFLPVILDQIVFMHLIHTPYFTNLAEPSEFGLEEAISFQVEVDSRVGQQVSLGVWHIPPGGEQQPITSLASGSPCVLYFHGNMGSRGLAHRVDLYRKLVSYGYHVIAFDYRGFGDSTGHPTEEGLVQDGLGMLAWLKERVQNKSDIILWGHSLGTAVSTQVVAKARAQSIRVQGLVLEAPFNNLKEASKAHTFSAPFRHLPYYDWAFLDPLRQNFSTDEWIKQIGDTPVTILHAEDDEIIGIDLAKKLTDAAKLKNPNASMVTFSAAEKCRHNFISTSKIFGNVVKEFVRKCQKIRQSSSPDKKN